MNNNTDKMKTEPKYHKFYLVVTILILSFIFSVFLFAKKTNQINLIPQDFPLELIEPNGNEIYSSGMDTVVRWKGVGPDEVFQLEYSSDKGNTWNLITNNAKGLSYNWKVPNISSDNCLMRISGVGKDKNPLDSIVSFGYGELTAMDISPDGKYFVTRSKNGLLIIWDIATKNIVRKIYSESVNPELLSWSSKDRIAIAIGLNDIKIIDLKLDSIFVIKTNLSGKLTAIAWNPDGEQIACGDISGKIAIVNAYLQNVSKTLDMYPYTVRSISWSPLGINLLSGHGDGAILLWELNHKIPSFTVLGYHNGLASAVAWSPKGDLIASGGVDQRIIIQDLQGNVIKSLSAHKGRITVLDWNKTGTQLLSGSDDNIVKRWSKTGVELAEYPFYHSNILSVRWNTNNYEFFTASADNNLFMISSINDKITRSFEGYSSAINSISWNPVNPNYVATAGNDYKFYIWDIRTKQVVRSFFQNDSAISSIAYNPQGTLIAAGLTNGNIILFNASSGDILRAIDFLNKHKQKVNSVLWSLSGNMILSCSDDNTIKTWDKNTGNMIDEINPQSGAVLSMDIKPTNNYIACGFADNSVKIFNLTDMELVRSLNIHKSKVISVKWNSSGDTLATMSSDGQISLWNTSDINQIKFIKTFSTKANPSVLSWNPKTNILASAGGKIGTDGVYLWDNNYGLIMANYPVKFNNIFSPVISVQWDYTGNIILAGGSEGILSLLYFNGMPSLIQTDISDNVWKIIAPNVTSKDIDMGTVEVGSDTTVDSYGFLVNMSKIPVRIDSITLIGSDKNNFDFIGPQAPFILEPYDVESATFTFHPVSVGHKTCDILIYTQNDTLHQKISGIGINKSTLTYTIDFGSVQIGSQKDSDVVILKNVSKKTLNIIGIEKVGKDSSAFVINSSLSLPIDLLPNQIFNLNLSYIPDKIGEQTCNIKFRINGIQQTFIAKLIGKGITLKPSIQVEKNDNVKAICNNYQLDTIAIGNSGQEPLIISSINWIKNDNSAFSIVQSLVNIPINSNEIKYIILAFEPPKAGNYNAELQIKNNSYHDSILTIEKVGIKDSVNLLIDNREFYFYNLCYGDTINADLLLKNTGNVSLNLNLSTNKQNINLSTNTLSLDTSQSDVLGFSLINNSNLPSETYQIFIENQFCHKIDTININVNTIQIELQIPNLTVLAEISSFKDTLLRITNLSDSEIQIDSIKITNNNEFQILDFAAGLIIKANEQEKIKIRFAPLNSDIVSAEVHIYGQPCNFETSFNIKGVPELAKTIISIDSVQAKTGEIVEIPIRINFPQNYNNTDTIEFKTLLSFNKNLLYPLFDNMGYIVNNKRYIRLDIKTDTNTSGIVSKLKFRAMLGDEESTILKLDSTTTVKGYIKFTEKDGLFILSDVCHQGGDRLIIKSGELTLLQNQPNPAKDITTINYYLNEEGHYELSLYNSLGNKIIIIANGYGLIGNYKIKLNVLNLPDGTYFYILRSNTKTISKLLIVIK